MVITAEITITPKYPSLADLVLEVEKLSNSKGGVIQYIQKARRQYLDLLLDNYFSNEEFFRSYQVLNKHPSFIDFIPYRESNGQQCFVLDMDRDGFKIADVREGVYCGYAILRNKSDSNIQIYFLGRHTKFSDERKDSVLEHWSINENDRIDRERLCNDWHFLRFYGSLKYATKSVIEHTKNRLGTEREALSEEIGRLSALK